MEITTILNTFSAILSLVGAYFLTRKDEKETKKKTNGPLITLCIGVIVLIISTIVNGIQSKDSQKDKKQVLDSLSNSRSQLTLKAEITRRQSDSIKNLVISQRDLSIKLGKKTDSITTLALAQRDLATKLSTKTDTVASLYKKLYEDQKSIVTLNKQMNDYNTGANSYCYIRYIPNLSQNEIVMKITHEGPNPLVNVTAIQLNAMGVFGDGNPNIVKMPRASDLATIKIGNVNVNDSGREMIMGSSPKFKINNSSFFMINVYFKSQSSRWFQRTLIEVIEVNSRKIYNCYYKIYKVDEGTYSFEGDKPVIKEIILKEEFDTDYPLLNSQKKVDETFWKRYYLHFDGDNIITEEMVMKRPRLF